MQTQFSSEEEFISAIVFSAQKACKRYGYLPSVLIAQACLENGYGIPAYWDNTEIKYLLQYNNMIGQKADLLNSTWYDKTVWPGKSFNKKTPEEYAGQYTVIKDNFRIFDDIQQSFCDFILFLLYASNYGYNQTPKYGKQVVNIKDPEKLITQVAKRGYASGSTYPAAVMKIIKKHNLTKFDNISSIEESNYIPNSLKNVYKTFGGNKMATISDKVIRDITAANLYQVQAQRGNNPIQWIVIHYLGVANADNPYLYGGGFGGHYNIQRNGEIYKAADPRTAVVWHCGGGLQGSGGHQYLGICTNYNSIGIENGVCYDGTWYFTQQTQESLVFLVSKLMDEYNIDINHVIRHYDVTGKICPAPYVNNDKHKTSWTWNEFKAKLIEYRNSKKSSSSSSSSKKSTPTVEVSKYPVTPFNVQVIINDLNIRSGPGTNYPAKGYTGKGSFSIVERNGDWGKLKSGAGWIYLSNPSYCIVKGVKPVKYIYDGLDYSLVFNPTFYSGKYADLKKAFGTNALKLFTHFCDYGMKEGRQAISSFNVAKYKSYYKDLQKAFGNNNPEYYKHYIKYGYKEKRKAV